MADGGEVKIKITGDDSQFKKTVNNLESTASKGLKKVSSSAAQVAGSIRNISVSTETVVSSANKAKSAIQSFNRGWQDIKQVPNVLKNVGGNLKNNVVNGLTSAKLQTSLFAASLKTLGQQKLTGLVDSVKQFKTTITEGKSGLSGFTAGLKNIGKISVAGAVNGIKSLVQHSKEFAKTKIDGVIGSFKQLPSLFKNGLSGSSSLLSGIKKVAGVSLNGLHTGILKIGSLAKSAAGTITGALGGAIKSIAKGLTVAMAAGATAVTALVSKSVSAYGDYEQFVGGVETLFKDNAKTVQNYANVAYRTAGLSANQYMDTVTSFSASLIQSLGGDTAKAASMADMAIIDMSDNCNKMGTDMQSIQWAYQGFAKQNYTMLDNLKLGYGGTKEEMQRLLSDAEKLTGKKFDLSSFADIVEAIHAIQENMDITGTTAQEAEHTIQGSAASMKAAWQNMLVALITGGGDFDRCIDALVKSALTFGENVMPAVESALQGVAKLIEGLAPVIAQVLPGLLNTVLPQLLNAATIIVNSLVESLPGLVSAITPSLVDGVTQVFSSLVQWTPQILAVGLDLILALSQGIISGLPQMIQSGSQSIIDFCNALTERIPEVLNIGMEMVTNLAQGAEQSIPQIANAGMNLITTFIEGAVTFIPNVLNVGLELISTFAQGAGSNLAQLLSIGVQAVLNLCTGIAQSLPTIISAAMQLILSFVQGIISNLPNILSAGLQLIMALIQGIVQSLPLIINSAIQLITSLAQGIISNLPQIIETGIQIIVALIGGILQAIPQSAAAIPQLCSAIIDVILNTNWLELGLNIVKSIGSGIKNGITGLFSSGEEAGTETATGVESGIHGGKSGIYSAATSAADSAKQGFSTASDTTQFGTAATNNFSQGILSGNVSGAAQQKGNEAKQGFKTAENTTDIGQTAGTNFASGVEAGGSAAPAAASNIAQETVSAFEPINTIPESVSTSMSEVVSATSDNMSQLPAIASEKINAVQTSFDNGFNQIKTATSTAMSEVKTIISSTDLSSVGANVVQGLINGMNSKLGEVRAVAAKIAAAVAEASKAKLDIHSPSRVFAEIGKNVMLGLVNGLEDNQYKAWYAMYNASEKLLDSEKFYLKEKQRLEDEAFDKEYQEKLDNAKDSEEIEKIKQEYTTKAEEEGRDKYLEILKESSEKERRIYEDNLKAAEDSYKNILEKQKKFADNLGKQNDHLLYGTVTDSVNGFEFKRSGITTTKQLKAYAASWKEYSELLDKIRNIEGLPKEVFEIFKDLNQKEGYGIAQDILKMNANGTLSEWIDAYTAAAKAQADVSNNVFKDEAAELANALYDEFGEIPEEFIDFGTESADNFGKGFLNQIKTVIAGIKANVLANISSLMPTLALAGPDGNTSNTYNASYYIQPSAGESTQAQLLAIRSQEKINKYRMG